MLLKILLHAGLILRIFTHIEKIVERIVKGENKLPTQDDINLLIQDFKDALSSGLIDFPGIDEKQLVEAITKAQEQLAQKYAKLQNLEGKIA